jgi:hypothetical protein
LVYIIVERYYSSIYAYFLLALLLTPSSSTPP